jgi:hypothetical protein
MNAPGQSGSEAFRKLDAFMSEPHEECVEAFQWLPLLTTDDWRLLESIWCARSAYWRACLVCIVGEFPGPFSQAMLSTLRLGVADSENMVAENAAIWLASRMLEHPELVPLDRNLIRRFRELLQGERGGIMGEVREVLHQHGEAE